MQTHSRGAPSPHRKQQVFSIKAYVAKIAYSTLTF